MKPLKIIAIVAEAVVVCSLAISSYNAAFGGRDGINWMAAAPLLTVVALESLRIPTALNLIKAGPITILMSLALIVGLSVITMEAASIGFENLIFERTRPVVEAERDLEKVMIGQRTIDKEAKRPGGQDQTSNQADSGRRRGQHREGTSATKSRSYRWWLRTGFARGLSARASSAPSGSQVHPQLSRPRTTRARGNREAQKAHSCKSFKDRHRTKWRTPSRC